MTFEIKTNQETAL